MLNLPKPITKSDCSVEEALSGRKSLRRFTNQPLSQQELGQLLWAAYGQTSAGRTVPSAGAIYPLEIYLIVRRVEDFEPGVYRYWPDKHQLSEIQIGDIAKQLKEATFGQSFIKEAPLSLVFAFNSGQIDFAYLEAGHASQNVYLQAQSLGLGTVAVGAFDEELIRNLLNIPDNRRVVYLMPVGNSA